MVEANLEEHRNKTFVTGTICRNDIINLLHYVGTEKQQYINIIDNLSDEQMEYIANELTFRDSTDIKRIKYLSNVFTGIAKAVIVSNDKYEQFKKTRRKKQIDKFLKKARKYIKTIGDENDKL